MKFFSIYRWNHVKPIIRQAFEEIGNIKNTKKFFVFENDKWSGCRYSLVSADLSFVSCSQIIIFRKKITANTLSRRIWIFKRVRFKTCPSSRIDHGYARNDRVNLFSSKDLFFGRDGLFCIFRILGCIFGYAFWLKKRWFLFSDFKLSCSIIRFH